MIRPTTLSPPPPAATRPPRPPPPPDPRRSSIDDVSRLAFPLNRTRGLPRSRASRDPTTPVGLRAQDTFPRGAAITRAPRPDADVVAGVPVSSQGQPPRRGGGDVCEDGRSREDGRSDEDGRSREDGASSRRTRVRLPGGSVAERPNALALK